MAKNKKLRKQLDGIRNDLADLYNTLNSLEETIVKSNSIWQSIGTTGAVTNKYPITVTGTSAEEVQKALHERYPALASPSVPGSPENPIVDEFNLPPNPDDWGPETTNNTIRVDPGKPGYTGVVGEPRIDRRGQKPKPRDLQQNGYATAPEDLATNPMGGEPVRVDEVTPNLDKEASPYTFWFTTEELERLGIADMSYHLEEVPGREGRLRIVQGPPTQLLPGHEELVREKMDRKSEHDDEGLEGP